MATGAIVEEVALNLEEVADVTRRINTAGVSFFAGGLVVGVAVGFYFGRRWQREKLRAEAYAEAEEDVTKIKEYYSAKLIAAEGQEAKRDLAGIIEDRGYSTRAEEEVAETTGPVHMPARMLPPPVPLRDDAPVEEEVVVVSEEAGQVVDIWDYAKEREARSPDRPYVINQEELGETQYAHVTYTYYAKDDVLCDEDDTPLPHGDVVVGQDNLKWGHGSDDIDVVFVRNDELEIDMEICRSHKSYEEEVLGHQRDEQN